MTPSMRSPACTCSVVMSGSGMVPPFCTMMPKAFPACRRKEFSLANRVIPAVKRMTTKKDTVAMIMNL